MKELTYRFQNPHNSCEEVHYCAETKRYYVLMPFTPYSQQLCTCTPSMGYYEADCPVRGGLTYRINGQVVTTEENGEIIDYVKKEAYESTEHSFYRVKPEYADLPNYDWLSGGRLVQQLFDYMVPEHFEQVTFKRKDVYCMLGAWYEREGAIAAAPEPVHYHGDGAVLEDTFILDDSISPDEYWTLATGETGVVISSIDALRVMMDAAGLGEVWDYPMRDIDEAVANNEHLVLVESCSSAYECRVFEVTEEMYERYLKMSVLNNRHGKNSEHESVEALLADASRKCESAGKESRDKDFLSFEKE